EPALRDSLERLTEQFGERWARQPHKRLPWDEGLLGQDPAAVREALPPAYLALAQAAGRAEGVSPWWLIAHMLQESRFKARARSHAGALGPMQVLPRTGLRIAERVGFPAGDFFEDELYRPGVALRHAAWYLAALRHEFRGKLTLAIAAYNGGPRRFAEHTAAFAGQDYDLMVEEIGAHESRNYLRKVSDHLIRYAALYADDAEYAALRDAIAEPGDVPVARGEIRF
ncbi:MAG: transglycosylase SLT domain-containing protein, partial [Myxococcales bacterium]|nr:transglycosylase SLT domain-containing protein [Myxococcales bacterium]